MSKQKVRERILHVFLFVFYFFAVLEGSFCQGGEQLDVGGAGSGPDATEDLEVVWDAAKYISFDEIRPGMEGYCLTAYKGTEIEKFDLDVIDVVRNILPGRDAILVQSTDERFIHTGPVAGCSGSPVYIDGRLAGALAFAWTFSKDPVYGVTPIAEMLRVGELHLGGRDKEVAKAGRGFLFDFSKPIDFADINAQIKDSLAKRTYPADISTLTSQVRRKEFGGLVPLPCPLITSGLPAEVCVQLGDLVEPLGLMVVAGVGDAAAEASDDAMLVPGACLAVPLATGDITMAVIGTVTEVVGDKVYGFGHGFLGYGSIELPMATGQVHAILSNVVRSFKLSSALEIVGALMTDEPTAVCGRIGATARMIPLTVRVKRFDDVEKRVYDCRLADNRLLTPLVLSSAVRGVTLALGSFPPEHTIEYQVVVGLKGFETVSFENVSTGTGLTEALKESVGSVAILMNNPYKEVDITSIDVDVRVEPRSVISHIWSVDLSDSKVKAGQTVDIGVVVESFLTDKKKYRMKLKIPEDLAPGEYTLIVSGGSGYVEFVRKTAPYRFVSQNMGSLVEAMNNLLAIRRDKLYCVLVLPPGGLMVEKAELPDLPATKALVLQDAKRTLRTRPYPHWLETSLETGRIVIDKKVVRIRVEE